MIKVEEVSDPLNEAKEKVAEALILFCQVRLTEDLLDNNLPHEPQGQGLMPTINRRMSRQESINSQSSDGKGRYHNLRNCLPFHQSVMISGSCLWLSMTHQTLGDCLSLPGMMKRRMEYFFKVQKTQIVFCSIHCPCPCLFVCCNLYTHIYHLYYILFLISEIN